MLAEKPVFAVEWQSAGKIRADEIAGEYNSNNISDIGPAKQAQVEAEGRHPSTRHECANKRLRISR